MHSAMLTIQRLKKITNHSNFQSLIVMRKSRFFLHSYIWPICFQICLFLFSGYIILLMDSMFRGYIILLMDSMCRHENEYPVGFSAQKACFSGHAMFPQRCQFSFYTYKQISFSCVILPSSCPLIQ